jgi:hypothetical protein
VLADGYSEPDGQTAVSFGQTQARRGGRPKPFWLRPARAAAKESCRGYLEVKEAEGRRADAHIHPTLGDNRN